MIDEEALLKHTEDQTVYIALSPDNEVTGSFGRYLIAIYSDGKM